MVSLFKNISIFISLILYKNTISKKIISSHNYINNIFTSSQCIIKNNELKQFCGLDKKALIDNNIFLNKKLISISPGGYKGFYELGVLSYIKENYDLSNYIFSGASAGSWNALFASYKGNTSELFNILNIQNFEKKIGLKDVQKILKSQILNKLTTSDFDLDRLYIGVTTFDRKNFFKINIFTNFIDLEDAINCCIASSHIPFITGSLINIYHDMYTFDGGLSKYPYIDIIKPILHVTPDIWIDEKDKPRGFNKIFDILTIFDNDFDFYKLYKLGYNDSKYNKELLDTIFT
jgi:hypothetical protein